MLETIEKIKVSQPFIQVNRANCGYNTSKDIEALNEVIKVALFRIVWAGIHTIRNMYTEIFTQKPPLAGMEHANDEWKQRPSISMLHPLPVNDNTLSFEIPKWFRIENAWAYKPDGFFHAVSEKTFLYCLDALNCGTSMVNHDKVIKIPTELNELLRKGSAEEKVEFYSKLLVTYHIKGKTLDPKPMLLPIKSSAPFRREYGTLSILIKPVQYFTYKPEPYLEIYPYSEILVNIAWNEHFSGDQLRRNSFWNEIESGVFQDIGKNPQIDENVIQPQWIEELKVHIRNEISAMLSSSLNQQTLIGIESHNIKNMNPKDDGIQWSKGTYSKTAIGKVALNNPGYKDDKEYRKCINRAIENGENPVKASSAKRKYYVNLYWLKTKRPEKSIDALIGELNGT